MLKDYFSNLQECINFARSQDDLDILFLARERMNQLLSAVSALPLEKRAKAQQDIDDVLPMEWPLWMEACRYHDFGKSRECQYPLH
jgi:hypothetical protein